ncbi:FAD-binding domain-containing protein [Westerdykella ornata]|uniref:FAD-binding domain-containing protein n=1 Tax=Westerdykella ornata TaxID=318751 RepID=A0A6A6JSS4_WESOR|nr:FAD-binding domain-containing protein [Westerdykella ornata]KAF2279163.1 FAD-binding domain-containing protein [Westerdykella ornata]
MKVSSLLTASAFAAGAVAQAFEDVDFNVTEALLQNHFDVTLAPELLEFVNNGQLGSKRSLPEPCATACKSLKAVYGSSKLISQGTTEYTAFQAAYWSNQQASVSPRCVFKPSEPIEVSSTVLISRLTQCPFAVRGGTHASFAGASSIEGGITLSMENLNQIKVSSDKKTVDVGPGNRWASTYQALENHGLAVVGGRMSPVGVPGLVLGGGFSFFSNKLGWACDNVAAFEVVTASGRIITANATLFPDLYWALRGGGNNFGIVTNFKLYAFEQGKMWGGQRIYAENQFEKVKDAIFKFGNETSSTDTDAAQIVSFAAIPRLGNVAITQLHYAKPVASAPIFSDFNVIPAISDNTDVRLLSELAILMNEGSHDTGLRQVMWDVTFKLDRGIFDFLTATFFAAVPSLSDVEGLFAAISIQAITEGQLTGMQRNGGNALGLKPEKGPFFIMNMGSSWTNPTDDSRLYKFLNDITETVKAYAKSKGIDNDFVYLNYASEFQDPIASYGADNVERLRAISRKYDPGQVFQRLQPGGFKLSGGPPNQSEP